MKIRVVFLLVTLVSFLAFQCTTQKPAIQHVQNGIRLETAKLNVQVQFYADNAVRVLKWPSGGTPEKLSLSVMPQSLSDLNPEMEENGQSVTLSSSKMSVQMSRKDGKIQFFDAGMKSVLKEKEKAVFTPVDYAFEKNAFNVEQKFSLTPDEGLYGLGQHQDGT